MGKLADQRHELYASHRARGAKPAQAALASGFATGSGITTRLEQMPEIADRISELMVEIRERKEQQLIAAKEAAKQVGYMTGQSRAWVIDQLADNAIKARSDGDYKESNAALELIGKEFGMFDGGSQTNNPDGNVPSSIDIDSVQALAKRAMDSISGPSPERDEIAELAAGALLVAGQSTAERKRVQENREFTTGSETEAILGVDVDSAVTV